MKYPCRLRRKIRPIARIVPNKTTKRSGPEWLTPRAANHTTGIGGRTRRNGRHQWVFPRNEDVFMLPWWVDTETEEHRCLLYNLFYFHAFSSNFFLVGYYGEDILCRDAYLVTSPLHSSSLQYKLFGIFKTQNLTRNIAWPRIFHSIQTIQRLQKKILRKFWLAHARIVHSHTHCSTGQLC